MFSKKATKIEEIFTIDLTVTVKLTAKNLSIFVAFSENVNNLKAADFLDSLCVSAEQLDFK